MDFKQIHPAICLLSNSTLYRLAVAQYSTNACLYERFFDQFGSNIISVYSGYNLENGVNFLTVSDTLLAEFFLKIYTDQTVLFDNILEGNIGDCAAKIHSLLERTGISPDKIYLISGAANAVTEYEKFLSHNGIPADASINVASVNYWEYMLVNNPRTPTEIIYTVKKKEKLLTCLNRVIRPHRIWAIAKLLKLSLLDRSYCSFFPGNLIHTAEQYVQDIDFCAKQLEQLNVSRDEIDLLESHSDKFPLKLNIEPTINKNWADSEDLFLYDNSYFSLVTETYFFKYSCSKDSYTFDLENTVYHTEKTFKPILMKHPFIIISVPGTLEYLRKLGYRTFHPFINENYDLITDDKTRFETIFLEIERLSKFTDSEWLEWQNNISEIIEYNYNIFHNKKNLPKEMFIINDNF